MNNGGVFRKKQMNFSMVSNAIIRDESISLKAKGLYALIQSYITLENFTVYKGFLVNKCKEGKSSFDSAWKELKENGYLKQYKINSTDGFYYEYELLDVPDTDSPDTENPGVGNPGMESPDMENWGGINNTIKNNTITNNIISNHIISADDVRDKIGYNSFANTDIEQVNEIALLITEILNAPDKAKIRIAANNLPAPEVKKRFMTINKFHIDYVLDCLRKSETKIKNVKSYLLTALYNAPVTMSTYYQNMINNEYDN